ncbi:P-type conjugative transfer protein TrbL [Chitinimonas sp. BJB300]|uniref:P-type conjugative transfer protein TrbL n=1 Tax=Chitinimonas sp. BJB300 TaxID=1559339 RepID=UPI000C0C6DC8|nr:P-type conjugative transfer protein TrbL [Chitinimonas sp. BJB300]PHV13509.1 P-type conjugative transfer protein TrbL [Chitinimonas sp. BJB300]TSJ89807.1 P-type conjugative transfer protein TrbL [Chitinimonas sp. BJB300]
MNALAQTLSVFAQLQADRAAAPPSRPLDPELARRLRWFLWASLAVVVLYVLFGNVAWAATSPPVGGHTASFSLFDTLEKDAHTKSTTWFNIILDLVRPTFMLLGTIEICWAAAIWAFEKDNLNSLAVEIIKKIMFIGFFFALLQYAPEWIPTITGTFQDVGEKAAQSGTVTTDGIIALGMATIKLIWSKSPSNIFTILAGLGKIIVACFVTIGIVIAFVVVAAQYLTLKIESYILFAAGAIFLGLGSSSWIKDYVSKYLNYAINVGVRLLVLILILSLTLSTITQKGDGFAFEYTDLFELLAVAVLQAILGIRAPEMAGALLNGGAGLSAGSAMGAGTTSFNTMKMATSMASGGAGKVAGVLQSAAGAGTSAVQGMNNMGKAVSAGRELAKQEGKSGTAATLSGLGKAAGQAGRDGGQKIAESAKALPGKLLDAVKGKSEHGTNPGLFDRTKQNLQSRLAEGAAEKAGGGSSGSSTSNSTALSAATDGSAPHSGGSSSSASSELGLQNSASSFNTSSSMTSSESSSATAHTASATSTGNIGSNTRGCISAGVKALNSSPANTTKGTTPNKPTGGSATAFKPAGARPSLNKATTTRPQPPRPPKNS